MAGRSKKTRTKAKAGKPAAGQPPHSPWVRNQAELARALEVNKSTVCDWIKNPRWCFDGPPYCVEFVRAWRERCLNSEATKAADERLKIAKAAVLEKKLSDLTGTDDQVPREYADGCIVGLTCEFVRVLRDVSSTVEYELEADSGVVGQVDLLLTTRAEAACQTLLRRGRYRLASHKTIELFRHGRLVLPASRYEEDRKRWEQIKPGRRGGRPKVLSERVMRYGPVQEEGGEKESPASQPRGSAEEG